MNDYEFCLEPSIGTQYFKEYSKSILESFMVQVDTSKRWQSLGIPVFKGWTVDLTVNFYVYVTLKKAEDKNFTNDGGKIYVVAKLSGYVHPSSTVKVGPLEWFKYGLEDTANLMKPVTALPINGSESRDGDTYKYTMNYQQTMSMYKNSGNDSYDFAALYRQNFNRIGWKQSTTTGGNYMGFEVNKATDAQSHDGNPNIFGIHVFSGDTLGKASFKISCNVTFDSNTFDDCSETYELDLGQETMSKCLL